MAKRYHLISVSKEYVTMKGEVKSKDIDLLPEHFVDNPYVKLSIKDCENIIDECSLYNLEEVLSGMEDSDYSGAVDELIYIQSLSKIAAKRIGYLKAVPMYAYNNIATVPCIIR